MEFPTFFAVVKNGNTHLSVTVTGILKKDKAEERLKQLGHEFVSFEANRDAADKKAESLNKQTVSATSAPVSVMDELTNKKA